MFWARRRLWARLWWLRREAARRFWVLRMIRAVRSRIIRAAREGSELDCTRAEQAVRSWQTVNSVFFFPPQQRHTREEQVRYRRDELVT